MKDPRAVVRRSNGYCYEDQCVRRVFAELRAVLEVLGPYEVLDSTYTKNALPLEAFERLKRAREHLDDVTRFLPRLECWCVMKVYNDSSWKPSAWLGCTTKEQAEKFCSAMTAWDVKRAKRHNWSPEKWIVELGPCLITEVMAPETDADEYVKGLSL